MAEEKKLKCAHCGKDLPATAGWQVGLKPIGPGSLVYFDICNDCRVIWQIAMGKWIAENGKAAKESIHEAEVQDKDKDN